MNRFETFTCSILELNRYLQKIKDLEMKPLGLRANHVMCLYFLGKNPAGLTVSELTDACKEDKAAVSRCLAQLEEQGLVCRDSVRSKRAYRAKLRLTESGKETVHTIDRRIDAALTRGGQGLTEHQRESFYSTMDLILENLSCYIADHENKA